MRVIWWLCSGIYLWTPAKSGKEMFHFNTLQKCCKANSLRSEPWGEIVSGYKIKNLQTHLGARSPHWAENSVWCANSVFSTVVWPRSQKNTAWEQSMWAWAQMLQSFSSAPLFLPRTGARASHANKRTQVSLSASLSSNGLLPEWGFFSKWKKGHPVLLGSLLSI